MDIFNRPHSIAEDTLHYTIYPLSNLSDQTSVTSFAACIADYVQSLCRDFVWHRDSFEVKVVPEPDNAKAWILEGRMRVGDCVDDEWFTVWLLKQISAKWDVAISVHDSDGEFLLIEAADALPSWVQPTNSENRVWIYRSHLHLVPLSHVSPSTRKRRHRKLPGQAESDDEGPNEGDEDTFIVPEDAIRLVRDPLVGDTTAPPAVERLVWQRIAGYPDAMKEHVHVTKAYIPEDIAKALKTNPSLVQRAAETFYTRDAIQLRAAHRMSRFPPHTAVLSSVKMTRTAYAQLVGQKFFAPKIFRSWKEPEGGKEWKWRDVGMKIAVGFEMLYQESKGRNHMLKHSAERDNSAAEATKEALRRNPDYQKYIENLRNTDYFKGELNGSALWNDLENKAAATFVEVRRTDDASRQSFATQADGAASKAGEVTNFSIQEEGSDDWLNVDAQEFEEMLEATMKTKTTNPKDPDAMDTATDDGISPQDKLAEAQAAQLKNLASKVEDFLDGEGDLEGATFEDEEFSDEIFSDDDEKESSSDSEMESEDSESEDSESEESKATKRQTAMANLVPALAETDYGKMPASYHSNSQRLAPDNMDSDAYDGTIDQDGPASASAGTNSSSASAPKTNPVMRPPIIPRDKYDGVDSDDETDEEGEVDEEDESEEDRPQVVGDIDIDMDEEEEEFLEFSRQALGISDSQWAEIVKDRQERGAFLPLSATKPLPATQKPASEHEEKRRPRTHTPRVPEPGPRPNVNPDLDSFETVMQALDKALQSKKSSSKASTQPPQSSKPRASTLSKGKEKIGMPSVSEANEEEEMGEDDDFDVEAAMQAELKEALEGFDENGEEPLDYNMIKNFLESYKSQAGLSGPVSNLAGRLQPGFKLPQDDF